jgi:hypothetical protein
MIASLSSMLTDTSLLRIPDAETGVQRRPSWCENICIDSTYVLIAMQNPKLVSQCIQFGYLRALEKAS